MKMHRPGMLIILMAMMAASAFSGQAGKRDLSHWFPQFSGCERVLQPIVRDSAVWEQTAVYERAGFRKGKDVNYFGCGSITVRREANALKLAEERLEYPNFPLFQKLSVRGYPAFQHVPWCGNDVSLGSTSVFFDPDKVITVHVYQGAEPLAVFLETTDYEVLRKAVSRVK